MFFDGHKPPHFHAEYNGEETALRQSLIISHGGLDIFVKRPLALGALLIALAFLLFPLIPTIGKKREKFAE